MGLALEVPHAGAGAGAHFAGSLSHAGGGVGSPLVLAILQHHHTCTCTNPGSCCPGPSCHCCLVVRHFALPVVPPLVVILHVLILVAHVPFLTLLSSFLVVMFELLLSSPLLFCSLSLGSCSHHSVAPAIGFILTLAHSSQLIVVGLWLVLPGGGWPPPAVVHPCWVLLVQ
jgi:hypothetical protein